MGIALQVQGPSYSDCKQNIDAGLAQMGWVVVHLKTVEGSRCQQVSYQQASCEFTLFTPPLAQRW